MPILAKGELTIANLYDGQDGTTTYTWVKYAEDKNGGGMSNYPEGKRFIGLAFNKTTQNESTTPSHYQWSEMPQNIEVGGRNLLKLSNMDSSLEMNSTEAIVLSGWASNLIPSGDNLISTFKEGEEYTLSFDMELLKLPVGVTHYSSRAGLILYSPTTGQRVSFYNSELVNVGDKSRISHTFICPEIKPDHSLIYYTMRNTEPISLGDIEFTNLKLEKGNIATDWTPAPEDVQASIDEKADLDYVTDIQTELNTTIEREAGLIRTEVEREYTAKSELEEYRETVSTQFEQNANSFNFTFQELIQQIETVDEETRVEFEKWVRYIRFVGGNIVLGEVGNEITLQIQHDRISFLQSGAEVAYFSNNKLYVLDVEVLNSLQIGNFAYIPRANGSLDFKRVIN